MRTYSTRRQDVLGEEQTLRLDNKEVDQLIQIPGHVIQRRLWHCVVPPRADLSRESRIEERASSCLCGNGNTKDHPCELQRVAEKVKITGGEDEGDGTGIRDSGGTGVLPAEERAEEGVIVCQCLAGGSESGRSRAESRECGELGGGLGRLVLDVYGNRAWRGGMVSSDPAYFFYGTRGVPLEKVSLTFWVAGWFAAAL